MILPGFSNFCLPEFVGGGHQIVARQQKAKNQMSYFRLLKNSIVEYLKDINEGSINVGRKVYDNLENTLECALAVVSFWHTDYSKGFHNPDLYESSVLTSMEEMKRALFETKKTEKQF